MAVRAGASRWRMAGRVGAGLAGALLLALIVYAGIGYFDALRDSTALRQRADALIAQGRGPDDLTAVKLQQFLRVEDPGFYEHGGVDLASKGAGWTTVTQSLSKRLAFQEFRPGIGKIRQTAYAMGLEQRLTKAQILALFFDTAGFGRSPTGLMRGVFAASAQVYGRAPAQLTEDEWLRLVAVGIAPTTFDLFAPDKRLDERVRRIKRLLASQCTPRGVGDSMLEGCA